MEYSSVTGGTSLCFEPGMEDDEVWHSQSGDSILQCAPRREAHHRLPTNVPSASGQEQTRVLLTPSTIALLDTAMLIKLATLAVCLRSVPRSLIRTLVVRVDDVADVVACSEGMLLAMQLLSML